MRFGIICLRRSVAGPVAEDVGFTMAGVADSQSVFRELYAVSALCAQATQNVLVGLSFAKTPSGGEVVDLSALIRGHSPSSARSSTCFDYSRSSAF